MRLPTAHLAVLGSLLATSYPASARNAAQSPGSTPTPVDACSFLKTGELSKSLGLRVLPGKRDDDGLTADGAYSSTCYWQIAPSDGSEAPSRLGPGAKLVILNVMHWPTAADTARFLQAFRNASADHTIDHPVVPLSKLGDESLWWGDGVAMRVGQLSFGVSTLHVADSEAERQRMAESLAHLIAARVSPAGTSP